MFSMLLSTRRFLSALIALSMFLLLCDGRSARAQTGVMEDCAGGTSYLLAFPDTTTNVTDARFPSQLIKTNTSAFTFTIYSPVQQTLRIGRANGAMTNVPIAAGAILEYDAKSVGVPLVTVINAPQTDVIKIEAAYPVIVYGYMLTAFGCEAYTAIPVESWGTEYFAATWPGENVRDVSPNSRYSYRAVPKQGEAEILIIAAYDNTQVRISPTAVLRDCAGCQTVTLRAGEAYLVQSTTDTSSGAERQPDLAGSFIQASKRIGVITGNPRVMHNKGVRPSLGENSFMNMNIEWITPVEQHGTEFVFTPTWDDRRQRDSLDLEESRDAELVRVYGTTAGAEETEISWRSNLAADVPAVTTPVDEGEFTHEKIGVPVARGYKTSLPAMAYSSPHAVVKFNGTAGVPAGGVAYLSWSSYMVEMVPREQWTSFVPVRAPALPTSMVHYLNLVTDSNSQFNIYYRRGNSPRQLFPFNRGQVPGTDLVWGSIQLSKGVDYFIEGDNGGRFTGHAYGSYRGMEEWRPRTTPGEYEENVALMYGFPLAPSRCVLASPDDYEIKTTQDCEVMNIEIKAKNNPAAGIRSITMLPDSSRNVRLEFVDPRGPIDIASGKVVEAKLRLVANDPRQNAHAVLIIRDRTRDGESRRIEYRWEAERIATDPVDVDFGEVTINTPARERKVTITNPLQKDIVVRRLSFVFGTEGFVIKRVDPNFNWRDNTDSVVLSPGESLNVWVDITPTEERAYADSLRIQLGCTVTSLPVKAATALPCIRVDDLDFGTLQIDQSRTIDLVICNRGEGPVTFRNPWLTWLQTSASEQGFGVAASEIDKLKGLTLLKDQCVTIRVSFSAGEIGTFGTTARFWANTRECRDTSVWEARVIDPSTGVAGDEGVAGYAIGTITPNPFTRETRIDFKLGRSGRTVVEIYSIDGERVAALFDEQMSAGEQSIRWNAEGIAAGVYHIRIRSGAWSGTTQVVLVR